MEDIEAQAEIFRIARNFSENSAKFVYNKIKECLPEIPADQLLRVLKTMKEEI